MTYWDQENRARLERNVVVQSGDEKEHRAEVKLLGGRAYPIKLEFARKNPVKDKVKGKRR